MFQLTDRIVLLQLHRQYSSQHRGSSSSIEELRNAFELAERSSPGITDVFVTEVVQRLQPNLSENRIRQAVERLRSK